jgi:hypothetical protein
LTVKIQLGVLYVEISRRNVMSRKKKSHYFLSVLATSCFVSSAGLVVKTVESRGVVQVVYCIPGCLASGVTQFGPFDYAPSTGLRILQMQHITEERIASKRNNSAKANVFFFWFLN